ncbi:MAG: anthranilate synthase component I [Acidobacteriaceae bacterium]|nr:anthranilate synthase component I [Acidobacteriaceae bacterium]
MPRAATTIPNATPSSREFSSLARQYQLVPVTRTVVADLETPVSAFLRVAAEEPEAFLLESVEGGERIGRYTFIGIRPYRRITARGTELTLREGRKRRVFQGDIFDELKQALESTSLAKLPGLPPFVAGAVGFFAYDVVRQIETLPSHAKDELGAPDAHLMFFDEVLAFDHVKKAIHLMVTAGARKPIDKTSYADALRRLDRLERTLTTAEIVKPKKSRKPLPPLKLNARTKPAQFMKSVDAVKEYIRAGDIFQCVLSQRFDCTPGVDPFSIYRSLRIVNPSPYMYFLRFPNDRAQESTASPKRRKSSGPSAVGPDPSSLCHIVGSSPELLVRVHNGRVEYRPIAGTRPRGADESSDLAHEASLRADAKEVAEHVMLVDLGRNDVGRVSEYGSVKVTDLMFVERYSHVMHLVSSLEGTLREGLSPLDAFKSCFPAGTLSGAPKIRAMEIIDELEPARRGVYGGSIVYADFSGNFDSCIAIRTLFMDGDQGHIQSGAGIVADSVPEKEHEECKNKAAAVVRAIERARTI